MFFRDVEFTAAYCTGIFVCPLCVVVSAGDRDETD
jgi:hypothetical protein